MKNMYLLALFAGCYPVYSQDQVVFDYDNAGNQVTRELICISCDNPLRIAPPEFVQSQDYEEIVYHPNPVLEELQIKWPKSDIEIVTSIAVYTVNGQTVNTMEVAENAFSATLNFNGLPPAVYTVLLYYSNGTKKDIKVLKK